MPRLRVLDLRGANDDVRALLPRPREALDEAAEVVDRTIDAVRERGDDALRELTERFDGVALDGLIVDPAALEDAWASLEPDVRAALEQAAAQVRAFHEQARPADWSSGAEGARMGQWYRPVQRVGVYVPGGKAAYPSTVLMTVVPARVAGVDEVVLCTPPSGGDGTPNTTILAAAHLAGVDRVVQVGGAQAIAAMAFGTESVPRCDKVVGPGNRFVALAKQRVAAAGLCGIDAVAGPTEIAIIADDTADTRILAADLVAQAEHDELATAFLITTAPETIDELEQRLDEEVTTTRHRERVEAALAGQGTVAIVSDIDQAVAVAEQFAAEHLEIQCRDARAVAERVRFAGTTFIGSQSPVSLGDYAAGPNHTLPTSGTARFTGGLTTASYLVAVNWVEYDRDGLAGLAGAVRTLAAAEDLPAHARAVDVRLVEQAPPGAPRPHVEQAPPGAPRPHVEQAPPGAPAPFADGGGA